MLVWSVGVLVGSVGVLVGSVGVLVSCTSCETLECTKTQLSDAVADYVSTHVCYLDLKTDKLSQTVRTQQSLCW